MLAILIFTQFFSPLIGKPIECGLIFANDEIERVLRK